MILIRRASLFRLALWGRGARGSEAELAEGVSDDPRGEGAPSATSRAHPVELSDPNMLTHCSGGSQFLASSVASVFSCSPAGTAGISTNGLVPSL